MKHFICCVLLFAFLSFPGPAQEIRSASNPSCITNCDILRISYFCGNETSSFLRLSYIGPYSSGSYFLNKDMVLSAYDGSRRIGTYYARNCYFIDSDGSIRNMSFGTSYAYQPGKKYCDVLIEFQPIPLYATKISVEEPSSNDPSVTPWYWYDIATIPDRNYASSSSSYSSGYSSSGSSSQSSSYSSNDNSTAIGLGILLGLAAIAIDALTDNDSQSSSSSYSSSSSSYNDLYVSYSDIQSTNSICTQEDLHFYGWKGDDYDTSIIALKNGHDYNLHRLRNTSSSSRFFIYVYDIAGKECSRKYFGTSGDAIHAIEQMDCRFCKWFKNKNGRNATYSEFNNWLTSHR